jgi:hypothetical protein
MCVYGPKTSRIIEWPLSFGPSSQSKESWREEVPENKEQKQEKKHSVQIAMPDDVVRNSSIQT